MRRDGPLVRLSFLATVSRIGQREPEESCIAGREAGRREGATTALQLQLQLQAAYFKFESALSSAENGWIASRTRIPAVNGPRRVHERRVRQLRAIDAGAGAEAANCAECKTIRAQPDDQDTGNYNEAEASAPILRDSHVA